jgi:hypothetical protein
MVVLRLLLVVFNVAVVTLLIYKMLNLAGQEIPRSRKVLIIAGGVLLLLAPLGMFVGLFMPSLQYFLIYPLAISLFLYLTKQF